MPIYEYKCNNCNYIIEKLQKHQKDTLIEKCPNCQSCSFKKIMSLSSFKLKGSGWYVTDFKNKQTNKEKS